MSDEPGSAVAGPTVEWRLYNSRRHEERTFTQAALSIEGEARLLGLARKVGAVLGDAGYTFGQVGDLVAGEGDTDWPKVLALVSDMAAYAPDLIADAMTILFGIYPTNEDDSRNASFDDDRLFLRGAVNTATVMDAAQVFIRQNEYSRLIGPFSQTLAEAMDAYAAPRASSEASGPQSIVGGDGSVVLLESETPSDGSTTEATSSETPTPSVPSPASPEPVSDSLGLSGDA